MIALGVDPGQTGGLALVSLDPKGKLIENAHAMPGQGVSSSFQFGRMFGGAEMVVQYCCDKPMYVTPQAWKGHYGLGSAKNASIALATMMFETDKFWKLKKHDGVAEAALIAAYGIYKETGIL